MINTDLDNIRLKKDKRKIIGFIIKEINKKEISKSDILLVLLSFFISKALIMDNLTPFGIAFITSYSLKYKPKISMLIASSIGFITVHGLSSYKYIIPMITIYLIINVLEIKKGKLFFGILSGVILFTFKFMMMIGTSFYLYDLMIFVFEAIIVFAISFIFTYSIDSLDSIKNRLFTNEEMISSVIMLSVAVTGASDITLFNLSLMDILGVFLIMFFAYSRGISMATVTSASMGLISSMSKVDMPYIVSIYAISGLLSGIFKDLGKR